MGSKMNLPERLPQLKVIPELLEFQPESSDQYTGLTTIGDLIKRKKELDAMNRRWDEKTGDLALEKKWIGEQLLVALAAAGHEKVDIGDGCTLKVGNGRAPDKVIITKLIEQGVTVDQINAATERGHAYTFAQIMKKGKEE